MTLQLSSLFEIWSLEFNYALRQRNDCASTTHKNNFSFYLSFYFICVSFSSVNFFSHLWIFLHLWFFSLLVNFHRRFIFVHSTSFRHSFVFEMNFNYKKNFFLQIQFFFFFSSALTNVQSFWNEEHFERSAIIVFLEKSAIVKRRSDDFFRELKTLIFLLYVNGSRFIDNIYCTLMKCCKNDVDAIVLRCQISWLIILIEMTLSYVLYNKIFFFITAARRHRWPCALIKFLIFK